MLAWKSIMLIFKATKHKNYALEAMMVGSAADRGYRQGEGQAELGGRATEV